MVLSSLGKRSRAGRSASGASYRRTWSEPWRLRELRRSPRGGLGAELDRIEAAVDAGDLDVGRLGFWRVVRLIKLDDDLIDRHADQAGRIDAKAFRPRFPILVPVWLGNSILGLLIVVGAAAVAFALGDPSPMAVGWSLLVAAGAWMVGFHSSAHWLIGRAVGIRFRTYFAAFPTAAPGSEDRLRDVPPRVARPGARGCTRRARSRRSSRRSSRWRSRRRPTRRLGGRRPARDRRRADRDGRLRQHEGERLEEGAARARGRGARRDGSRAALTRGPVRAPSAVGVEERRRRPVGTVLPKRQDQWPKVRRMGEVERPGERVRLPVTMGQAREPMTSSMNFSTEANSYVWLSIPPPSGLSPFLVWGERISAGVLGPSPMMSY